MYKCFISLTVVTLVSCAVSALEDCESCVPISQCSMFKNMGREDQHSWMRKYPCSGHPDDYGTPPSSIPTQGAYICCPNEIWGIENKITSPRTHLSISNPISEENRSSNRSNASTSFGNQNQYPSIYYNDYPYNQRQAIDTPTNTAGGNKFTNSLASNPRISDSDQNRNPYENNDNQNRNFDPKRWSTSNKNKYWNERPDKSKWDIGNHNFYNGYNKNPGSINNGGNDNRNNQRPREFFNNNNSQGLGSQNNFNSNPNLSNESYRPGNSQNSGQCDRLARFPPDSQTGCCGREASDDDRITDSPFRLTANNQLETKLTKTIEDTPHATNNFAPAFNPDSKGEEDLAPRFQITFSIFKDEEMLPNATKRFNSTGNIGRSVKLDSLVEIDRRIAGGKETELTQYPWTALLITTFDNGQTQTAFNCGGSLISARFVLTAGHCVYDEGSQIKSVQVYLAEFDKRTFPRDCKMTADVQKCVDNISVYAENVIRHPQFNEKRLLNDIALIKLQQDAPYTDYIRPICLPSINIDDPEHARLTLAVAGWGRNGLYKSDIKQSTTVHLVPQHECRKFYPDLTPRHLCASGYTGEDTCKGDSGGPLMGLYRGIYYVVGVVSGKRTDAPCGSAVPSLYTNVYHYLDWIRRNINN